MKYFLSILFSVLLSNFAFAKCSSEGIWAYPNSKSLPQNGVIILEGYAKSQSIINSLESSYPIYLKSDDERVELEIIEINKGAFRITQAVLKPKTTLKIGKTYVLCIDNLTKDEQRLLKKYNYSTEKTEQIQWSIVKHSHLEKPLFENTPILKDQSVRGYGCGPAINTSFELKIKNNSSVFIKVELVDLSTNQSQSYYLNYPKDGIIKIGHSMCSGAFTYPSDGDYQIRFSLMDAAGDTDKTWTDWLTFEGP